VGVWDVWRDMCEGIDVWMYGETVTGRKGRVCGKVEYVRRLYKAAMVVLFRKVDISQSTVPVNVMSLSPYTPPTSSAECTVATSTPPPLPASSTRCEEFSF